VDPKMPSLPSGTRVCTSQGTGFVLEDELVLLDNPIPTKIPTSEVLYIIKENGEQ
jgi:hypothetical protein